MKRWWRYAVVATVVGSLAAVNALTQSGYFLDSMHRAWRPMFERLHALTALPPGVPVLIGLQDVPKPNLVALYVRGHPAWTLGGRITTPLAPLPLDSDYKEIADLVDRLLNSAKPLTFDLAPDGLTHHFQRFDPLNGASTADAVVVLPARDESVVNASQDRPAIGHLYAEPLAKLHNTLVEIDTDLGHWIIPGHIYDVALWQHEPDFGGSPNGIQGIGRHVLFEVLNPVPGSRLLLDFTSGGLAQQGLALPPAAAYGTARLDLGLEGHGAGRVLSEPITPREVDGHYYIALDMGVDAGQFTSERQGLAALYNANLRDDPRRLVGFVRNISLLSPDEVAALDPPDLVARMPADLMAPGLLFSGISEDGWLADKAWFRLGLPGASNAVRVAGSVPGFSPKILGGTVRLFVDGAKIAEGKLKAGGFDMTFPIPQATGPRLVAFELSDVDRLPAPDGRFVSIHLDGLALGLTPAKEPAPGPGN
jgi:hypothetical protein